MIHLQTNRSGELSKKDLKIFGGAYSFFEKLKKKGIGSPKIIYQSGIAEFDNLKRNVEGETGFVNFELLKNGLILRLNISQRTSCIGMKLNEVEQINLVGYRIILRGRYPGISEPKIFHTGDLEIIESDHRINFSVVATKFDGMVDFFRKPELSDKFNFTINADPPDQDDDLYLEILDFL